MVVLSSILMGGGIVQGQVQLGTGGMITAHDSCIFQTDTFYGNSFVEYYFISDATDFELTVQGREYVKFPVIFETMLVYNANDSLLDQYNLNQISWNQPLTVPSIGDTFLIRLETSNPPQWYEFDICLQREKVCVPSAGFILLPNTICLGDTLLYMDSSWMCQSSYDLTFSDSVELFNCDTFSFGINYVFSNFLCPPCASGGEAIGQTYTPPCWSYIVPQDTGWYSIELCLYWLDTIGQIQTDCYLDSFYVADSLHETLAIAYADINDSTLVPFCNTQHHSNIYCHMPCNADSLFIYDYSDSTIYHIDYIFSEDSIFSPPPPYSELHYITISPGDSIVFPIDEVFYLEFNCSDTIYIRQIYHHACETDTTYMNIIFGPPDIDFMAEEVCLGDTTFFYPFIFCGDTLCFDSLCNSTFAGDSIHLAWDFGDSTGIVHGVNPWHIYDSAGTYNVTLTATVSGFFCEFETTKTINVTEIPKPQISGPIYACSSDSGYTVLNYDPHLVYSYSIDTINPFQYSWDPVNPLYLPWGNNGGVLYVFAMNDHGCMNFDSIVVFGCCKNGNIVFNNDTGVINTYIQEDTISVIGNNVLLSGSYLSIKESLLEFSPNSTITVENGATLLIGKDCILKACNDLMWDGIYVEGGGTLLVGASVTIMDAKNAIVSKNGGYFDIRKTVFDKNFIHLLVDTFPGNHTGTIVTSTLKCSGTLLPQYPPVIAYRTQDAISVNNVASLEIGNRFAGNTIENCDVGIYATNSFVRVVGNTFENIESGSVMIGQPQHPRGYGILSVSLDMYGLNYYGLNTMPATWSMQGGNTFTNVTNGIFSFMNGNVNIRKNDFNYSNNPQGRGTAITLAEWVHPTNTKSITQNSIRNYNTGILVGNAENVRVYGNDVRDIKMPYYSLPNSRAMGIRVEGGSNTVVQGNEIRNTSGSNWRWEGISISNTGSMMVSCNTIRNMGKSIRFQGVNNPVEIKKNRMFSGTAGIVLSDDGFINEQGTSGTPWDNEWYNFSNRHLYAMNNTFADQIDYHIWYGGGPKHPNNFDNSSDLTSYFFNVVSENGSLLMFCAIPLMSATPTYSFWMDDVANNTNNNLQAPLHHNWMGRNGLFKTLKGDSSIVQNTNLQSFVQQLETESQGQLIRVNDTLLQQEYATAKQINLNLPAYTKPDSLSKDINHLFINAVQIDSANWLSAINPSGWDTLRYFASLCPFEYGENVYLSRIVLKLIGDTNDYFNECEYENVEIPGKSSTENHNEQIFAKAYPNPASDQITIECNIELPASLTLYSAIGQIVLQQNLNSNISVIDVQTIPEQLIIYEIKNNSGETVRGTIQIIH